MDVFKMLPKILPRLSRLRKLECDGMIMVADSFIAAASESSLFHLQLSHRYGIEKCFSAPLLLHLTFFCSGVSRSQLKVLLDGSSVLQKRLQEVRMECFCAEADGVEVLERMESLRLAVVRAPAVGKHWRSERFLTEIPDWQQDGNEHRKPSMDVSIHRLQTIRRKSMHTLGLMGRHIRRQQCVVVVWGDEFSRFLLLLAIQDNCSVLAIVPSEFADSDSMAELRSFWNCSPHASQVGSTCLSRSFHA